MVKTQANSFHSTNNSRDKRKTLIMCIANSANANSTQVELLFIISKTRQSDTYRNAKTHITDQNHQNR